jgi:hypothetical protein
MIADFRPLIGPAVPGIVNSVKDIDDDWEGGGALSQLSEQGKILRSLRQPVYHV